VPEPGLHALEIAMRLILQVFDRVMTSYSLAAAMVYLSLTYSDRGEVDRALYYIHNVRGYLKKCESSPIPEEELADNIRVNRHRFLITLYHLANHNIIQSTDHHRLFKCYISSHLLSKQYKKLVTERSQVPSAVQVPTLIGQSSDENIEKFLPLADMIRHDLEHHKDVFHLTVEVIDMMTQKWFSQIQSNQVVPKHEADIYSKRTGFYMIAQACKIQCLQALGEHGETPMRKVADHIAHIASFPHLHYCHSSSANTLALAITIQARFLDTCTNVFEQAEIMSKLKACMVALQSFANKYKIVEIKYGGLMSNAEQMMKAHQDHMQLMNLYSSLTARTERAAPLQYNVVQDTPLLANKSTIEPVSVQENFIEADELETLLSEFVADALFQPNVALDTNELFL
jgi:hypothetical protein